METMSRFNYSLRGRWSSEYGIRIFLDVCLSKQPIAVQLTEPQRWDVDITGNATRSCVRARQLLKDYSPVFSAARIIAVKTLQCHGYLICIRYTLQGGPSFMVTWTMVQGRLNTKT